MRLVTWNVNSLRAMLDFRKESLSQLLERFNAGMFRCVNVSPQVKVLQGC